MVTPALPPPVRGAPLAVQTDAGRISGYVLGEGRTVLLLHSFNAAGCGAELAALATRLASHRRVVLIDWLGFGTSDRPDAPYGPALYGAQLEQIREAARQPGEASRRRRRPVAAGPVRRRRRGRSSGALRSARADQSDRVRSLQGWDERDSEASLSVLARDRHRPRPLRLPRPPPGDPLVPRPDLRRTPQRSLMTMSGTAGERASSQGAFRAPLLSCPECSTTRVRRMRTGGWRTRPCSCSAITHASAIRLRPMHSSPRMSTCRRGRSTESGDLPQVERPDETAADHRRLPRLRRGSPIRRFTEAPKRPGGMVGRGVGLWRH